MADKDYIPEKELSNNIKSIPLGAFQFLLSKTGCICKIECSNGSRGTGFFCKIPYDFNIILKVLITNNHVLTKEDILKGKKIKFSINNEMLYYEIEIDKSRKTYTNEDCDITIIEIKQNDDLDKIDYFDIDKDIFKENPNKIFNNKQIYLLHYPKGNKMECSMGFIKNIDEGNYTIRHSCDTYGGSSGSPIINSINFHIIGIHKGASKNKQKNYNYGTFLKGPIKQFCGKNNLIVYINENENNEIKKNNDENNEIKKNNDENHEIKKNNTEKNEIKKNNTEKNDELMKEDINEIIIQYKIDDIQDSKEIRIFGDKFVENNKDKCKIIINGNEFKLTSHLEINTRQLNDNIFEIKLKEIRNITNMSYMFNEYDDYMLLSSLPDISKWNTSNVTKMNNMFRGCLLLSSLPDISKWNTTNVTNMSGMFWGCKSLSSLPDISKWNISNVKDISYMFYECESLSSLPDLSKWNTSNITDMSGMFRDCKSLSSLPDISNWSTSNVTDMRSMFHECKSLILLPDIQKWNISNVTDISYIFHECKSLTSIPDISNWNLSEDIDKIWIT